MATVILLIVIAWVIISTLLGSREKIQQEILKEMKDLYTKKEVLRIIYDIRSEVAWIYLAYGALIGILILIALQHK